MSYSSLAHSGGEVVVDVTVMSSSLSDSSELEDSGVSLNGGASKLSTVPRDEVDDMSDKASESDSVAPSLDDRMVGHTC